MEMRHGGLLGPKGGFHEYIIWNFLPSDVWLATQNILLMPGFLFVIQVLQEGKLLFAMFYLLHVPCFI